ncbi:MAG: hypothetical protein AB7I50_19125 [Vicinamibacterales bacterium]
MTIRYLLPAPQPAVVKTYVVAAASRLTVWANQEDPRLANAEMSAVVTSTNGVPIIAERAMWGPGDGWIEGHGAAGTTEAGTKWVLAEGESGGARAKETYVLGGRSRGLRRRWGRSSR